MGGGAGVGVNCTFSLFTDDIKFSMPETRANFCPDVGGTFFLNQCKPYIAEFVGLTG